MRAPPPIQRRAEPPRPSLLLGSVDACWCELDKLQAVGEALLAASAPPKDWAPLVHRYRWLRETLVSQHEAHGSLAATSFGAAADAALRAGDYGEFLKAVTHLAHGGDVVADDSPSPSSYAAGEADALLLLYFVCVPPRPEPLDAATRLRAVVRAADTDALPPAVAPALAMVSAVLAGDGLTFGRLLTTINSDAGWRAHALARALTPRAHARALATLGATYRSLPPGVAARLMGTGEDGLTGAVAAAGEGAAWARAWCESGGGELKFKG